MGPRLRCLATFLLMQVAGAFLLASGSSHLPFSSGLSGSTGQCKNRPMLVSLRGGSDIDTDRQSRGAKRTEADESRFFDQHVRVWTREAAKALSSRSHMDHFSCCLSAAGIPDAFYTRFELSLFRCALDRT